MKLTDIRDLLLTVGVPVSHYHTLKESKYIVWAEDGQSGSIHGDNCMEEQIMQGTIDYYTKTEYDTNVGKIQQALNDNEVSFRLNSVQYEEETNFIHYEWIFEVDLDG